LLKVIAMPFFCRFSGLAFFGICITANVRQLSLAVEVPVSLASQQCERHEEGCNLDGQLPMPRDDEMKGLELLQMDLRLQSNPVAPARQAIGQEQLESKMYLPAESFTKETTETEVVDKLLSGSRASLTSPSSSIAAREMGRVERDGKQNVSEPIVSDVSFHSPIRVFSQLEVSAEIKPRYSSPSRHRYVTEFLIAMQGLSLSGSRAHHFGTVPILILLTCMGAFILACIVGAMKKPKNERHQFPRATDSMSTPFGQTRARGAPADSQGFVTARFGDLGASADPRLPTQGVPAAQASLPLQRFDHHPICPALVLPHTEARFTIPIESLMKAMKASAVVDIKGTSGRKLLHGSVDEDSDGRRKLTIASCGHVDEPRVTVLAARSQPESTSTGPLEVYGKNMEFYGTLALDIGGSRPTAVLEHHKAGKVLTLTVTEAAELAMVALQPGSDEKLAAAGKNVVVNTKSQQRNIQSHDQWKLQVSPGCDAVLIAACMLAYLVLLSGE
jgi:hypothetical protein